MAQPLFFTKTIELEDKQLFLLVQVWVEKPSEIVLKLCKREDGSIATLGVFRLPLSVGHSLGDALIEAEKETLLALEIQTPIEDLYKKYGKDRVETVFARVKQQRIGTPE